MFTAGVITDVGELDATVDASTLPNLEGSTIVAALYNDLEPTIASYGAQIVDYGLGDDDLNILFDSPSTAGIAFGTTAQTDGVVGQIADVAPALNLQPYGWLLSGAAALFARQHRRALIAIRDR